MSDPTAPQSFGARAAAAADPDTLLALEAVEHKTGIFAEVDDLLGSLLVRGFQGAEVLGPAGDDLALSVPGLSAHQNHILGEHYAVASQHHRGAWYLPEQATIKTGLHNLAHYFVTYPRFATSIAFGTRIRIALVDAPAAVLAWAATELLFEQLAVPFDLRGRSAGAKYPEDQLAAWSGFDVLIAALGLEIADELAVMRYGGGWGPLRADAQLAAKKRLLDALAAQASPGLAARYRAYRLRPLIARYYEKAKGGVAKRRQVVTRALEKDLSAFFSGDWLAFVSYLGEQPHPDEHIDTALPEVKLMVGGATSAATVAESLGLPLDEVERALSTYWGSGNGALPSQLSPVEQRVAILRDYWGEFDAAHARHAAGMRPLWGLVEEDHTGAGVGWQGPEWYTPGVYRDLLSAALCARIEQAWRTAMLPRWPEHIVTNLAPHAAMADAFGPALTFWQGVGLTSWFVSEGPYSRTDMAGLRNYYSNQLAALEVLGCPVDEALFDDLVAGEGRLGPPEPITEQHSTTEPVRGVVFEMSMQIGTRRAGFEGLRDVVTRHRRAWAERHLETYLKARWDAEIREAARLYFQAVAERQKPPTPKQFARHAADATNHWFGGDLSAFFGAIGEKSPLEPERVELMPADPKAFTRLVFERMGGQPASRKRLVGSREEGEENQAEMTVHDKLAWLANQSLHLIQLEEAMRHTPEVTVFGRLGFEYRSDVLAEDPETAWVRYTELVEATRLEAQSTSATSAQSAPSSPPVDAAPAAGSLEAAPPPATAPWPPSPPPAPTTQPVSPPPRPAKRRRWFTRGRY